MKKKAFISLYVILLLLILSISVSFIYEQNKNDVNFNKDLYDKKQALYMSESVNNLASKDEGLEDYKKEVFEEIKDHYYGIIVREFKKEKLNILPQSLKINYDDQVYKTSLQYIDSKDYIRLKTTIYKGSAVGVSTSDYKISPKFDFKSKDPIVYDFKEDLNFENISLKENPEFIDLEEEVNKDYYYLIDGDLIIDQMVEEDKASESEDVIEEDDIENSVLYEEKEDLGLEEDSEEVVYDEEAEVNNGKYKGILYINGDLILKTCLDFEGLLIVNGQVKTEEMNKGEKAKLVLKGQLISKDEPNENLLDFTYDKKSFKLIRNIDNIFETKLVSKRVY